MQRKKQAWLCTRASAARKIFALLSPRLRRKRPTRRHRAQINMTSIIAITPRDAAAQAEKYSTPVIPADAKRKLRSRGEWRIISRFRAGAASVPTCSSRALGAPLATMVRPRLGAYYRDLVHALYDGGASRYVFCVNVDAVIAPPDAAASVRSAPA
jgi:hypothetical protein